MQQIIIKIVALKKDYQKALKKLNLFFLSNSAPFIGKIDLKQKGHRLLTSRSSGYETSAENLFIGYVLSD